MQIEAVREVGIEHDLLDHYSREYHRRYKKEPLKSTNGTDQTAIRDIVKRVGAARARTLITKYLSMNDKWFMQKGHDLFTLKNQLEAVHAAAGGEEPKASPERIWVVVNMSCDECGRYSMITMPADEMDKRQLCNECKGTGVNESYMDLFKKTQKKTGANKEFVAKCMEVFENKIYGKTTMKQFHEECDFLDEVADQINPGNIY